MVSIVDIATKNAAKQGRAPEEEDFLTAAVTHQHLLAPQERRYLQQDLASIENAVTTDEEFGFEEDTEDEDYRCEICGSAYRCFCHEGEYAKRVEPPPDTYVYAGCPNKIDWYGIAHVSKEMVAEKEREFEKDHAE